MGVSWLLVVFARTLEELFHWPLATVSVKTRPAAVRNSDRPMLCNARNNALIVISFYEVTYSNQR